MKRITIVQLFSIESIHRKRHTLLVCILIIIQCILLYSHASAQNDGIPRGAQLPYTRYESEDASRGGGATLQQTINHDYNTIASEATNQKYVSLPSNGSYVEWTTTASFQGFNMRFTLPDNAAGTGNTGSLALIINGTKVQNINLSSYWAYQYFPNGTYEPEQHPGGKTFMRFDEVHFRLPMSYPAGTIIRIAKDNGDAFTYGVDFLELEPVPPPLAAPENALSVTAYGANGSDNVDDYAAFVQCISAAAAQGKNVYIPAGRFLLSDKINLNVTNMKILGAGIWHTELFFTTDRQFYGGILARSSNVEIGHFSMNTNNNDRFKYNEANARVPADIYKIYKGFMGTYGTGSRIHDVWVEHFECGFWIAGYDPPYPIDVTTDLIISRARIRNNYADGVNFCQGTSNSVVEYSSIRNSGDDALAIWPNNAMSAPITTNNIFRYNTIENTWRAGGIAIFGGWGHQVFRNIIKDGVGGSAIRFTNDFPGYKFESGKPKIVLTDNWIERCGTSYDLWNRMRGAIEFNVPQGVFDMEFNNTKIFNSQRHAFNFEGSFTNVVFNNTTIDGTGLDAFTDQPQMDDWGGFAIRAQASGKVTYNNVSFNRIESYRTGTDPVFGNIKNHNTGFIIEVVNSNVPLRGLSITPTSRNMIEGETASLNVTFEPTNATNKALTWSTSNTAVATVTEAGTGIATVRAQGIGSATISARSADGNFVAQATINVTPAVNITAIDANAAEGGDVGVFRIGTSALSATITVRYTISGTASSADYSPALSGTVTLTPATPSVNITITPVDDAIFEGTETLTLTLQPGTGFSLGTNTSATISIADNDSPPCTAPVIGFTSIAPVLDQTIEAVWNTVPAHTISNVTLGAMPGDFSGSRWRALYDNTNLYLLVEVKDSNRINDSGASWWEDDVIEIFIDGDNSKGTSYDGVNDFQLGFRYNDPVVKVGGNSVARTTGITFTMHTVAGGYDLEARIPWATIGIAPAIGHRLGFDVSVDDDDNGGARDAQVSAFATSSMGWANPSLFGSVYLSNACTPQENKPVASVTVTPSTVGLSVGSTRQLSATISPADATNQNVVWTSSNPSVATVSAQGLVTAVAVGSATITVTTQDGNKTATASINVTLSAALPAPWATVDVGSVAAAGAASHSNGTFTLDGSGADIWGAADAFRFVHQAVTGDVTLTARVVSLTNTDPWAKAGVMIREGTSANAKHASTFVTISNGLAFQRRVTSGGESVHSGWAGSIPYWLRITRSGSTFISYVSTNGTSWTTVGSATIAMTAQVQVGLAVTAHNDGVLARAVFDNVSVQTGPVTDPAGTITANRVQSAITVNGQLNESAWDITRTIGKTTVGTPNNSATFGVLWDNTNLYIGARVLDASLNSDSPDPWDNDAIEIYIDANNNKLATYDGRDNQFIKQYNSSGLYMKVPVTGVNHAWASIAGGYSVELSIPWSQLGVTPVEGLSIGFDIGYDDDDNGGARDGQAVWMGTINNYQNTSAFGTLTLSGRTSAAVAREQITIEEEEPYVVQVYPNPVDDGRVVVRVPPGHKSVTLQVISPDGRLHHEQVLHHSENEVDVYGLAKGLYFFKAIIGRRSVMEKVMIK